MDNGGPKKSWWGRLPRWKRNWLVGLAIAALAGGVGWLSWEQNHHPAIQPAKPPQAAPKTQPAPPAAKAPAPAAQPQAAPPPAKPESAKSSAAPPKKPAPKAAVQKPKKKTAAAPRKKSLKKVVRAKAKAKHPCGKPYTKGFPLARVKSKAELVSLVRRSLTKDPQGNAHLDDKMCQEENVGCATPAVLFWGICKYHPELYKKGGPLQSVDNLADFIDSLEVVEHPMPGVHPIGRILTDFDSKGKVIGRRYDWKWKRFVRSNEPVLGLPGCKHILQLRCANPQGDLIETRKTVPVKGVETCAKLTFTVAVGDRVRPSEWSSAKTLPDSRCWQICDGDDNCFPAAKPFLAPWNADWTGPRLAIPKGFSIVALHSGEYVAAHARKQTLFLPASILKTTYVALCVKWGEEELNSFTIKPGEWDNMLALSIDDLLVKYGEHWPTANPGDVKPELLDGGDLAKVRAWKRDATAAGQ